MLHLCRDAAYVVCWGVVSWMAKLLDKSHLVFFFPKINYVRLSEYWCLVHICLQAKFTSFFGPGVKAEVGGFYYFFVFIQNTMKSVYCLTHGCNIIVSMQVKVAMIYMKFVLSQRLLRNKLWEFSLIQNWSYFFFSFDLLILHIWC